TRYFTLWDINPHNLDDMTLVRLIKKIMRSKVDHVVLCLLTKWKKVKNIHEAITGNNQYA
ncbi:MAG: hypothetical protein ACXWV1_14755, partial [Chitinophagaceae bacterium]